MDDLEHMRRAMALADTVRSSTAPNPWVGSLVVPAGVTATVDAATGPRFEGATAPPGGPHAEVTALVQAGQAARGATLYATLEPCAHQGRTPPCVDAIIEAGVARVVIGIEDPDPRVAGRGVAALRAAGIEVTEGVAGDEVKEQLAPYLKHRSTGQPWVVLKMAASLDGRTAAPDGTSRWITGEVARRDVHRLRAHSDAVLVGAGTVRADDPELTVRLADVDVPDDSQPLRVVLGKAPVGAKVHPALELEGELGAVLDELGRRGVLQLLVEGGATVAHDFHAAGLVDRYVLYLAPMLFGGDDARPLFAGRGAGTLGDVWTGRLVSVEQLGEDLRVEVAA
ncbi:MAG TPA: bifunctional diaminohydroxyphosphoribosylaminopyrimidine deaminase/5-amino-6-(5-phosphoribosylamino)uracil reductase RibD [Acidimicrobiales bacterium]|jgi:diaminohydroxyphosphoribosylaminopyrimidine deaminase/5-amino-6-(5-phosphoribosylamino)uracil reductase|nr:bifunctional diaminohydroxyphosphoribosylaminopyrimidine deaminase/5-amino-6-(5-phosphoribosylamino)uracil reductase RibD [Acidimicrobiales bacterium]